MRVGASSVGLGVLLVSSCLLPPLEVEEDAPGGPAAISSGSGGTSSGSGGTTTGSGGTDGPGGEGNTTTGSGGSGGSSGASGGSAGSSGGTVSRWCDDQAFDVCDDFEDATIDAFVWTAPAGGTYPAELVQSNAHSGTRSLRTVANGTLSYLYTAVPAQAFYVRAYMSVGTATGSLSGHTWYIVGSADASAAGSAEARFGASFNSYDGGGEQLDLAIFDNYDANQWSTGAYTMDPMAGTHPAVRFDADTWYCVEAFFDGPDDEFQLWVDGDEKLGLHVTPATLGDWAPTYQHVKIGAMSVGNEGYVWYDDVVVSTDRIGCDY